MQGAAGPGGSSGDKGLQHCDKPMGAMAVVEPQDYIIRSLAGYGLQSPVGLIRMMIQQSNCFIVVERGTAMQNMMQERALADSGQSRAGSNMGGGQMVTADFFLTPAVVFSENNAGGIGGAAGAFGGMFGRAGAVAGAVAGGLKFKEAQTSMLARRCAQRRAGRGGRRQHQESRPGAGRRALGQWRLRRPRRLRQHERRQDHRGRAPRQLQQHRRRRPGRPEPAARRRHAETGSGSGRHRRRPAPCSRRATCSLPKIANVKMLASPADDAKVIATLPRTEELVVVGAQQNGYINVQSATANGWVKLVLVTRP